MLNPGDPAKPVFVDGTGRRSRLFAAVGAAGGTALVVATAGLLAGFTGAGAGVLPGLPGRTPGVVQQPAPAQVSSRPATPANGRTASGRTTPTTTASPTAPTSTVTAPTASPTPPGRRNGPTQTPSHGNKNK